MSPSWLFSRPAAASVRWLIASRSHPGNVRSSNEDALLVREDYPLLAIADGMGGHRAGDVASQLIVGKLARLDMATSLKAARRQVEQSLLDSNEAIVDYSDRSLAGATAGSTAIVLLTRAGRGVCLWVGDSRLYRIRGGIIEAMTRDHSYVADLVSQGLLNAADAASHPASNVITRAVGANKTLEVDSVRFDIARGDTYLLCSDGLYNECEAAEMLDIASRRDVENSSARLLDLCLSRGARDNVSLIIARAL